MINKEQYTSLQPFEDMMRSAMKSNYARCRKDDFITMLDVYNRLPSTTTKLMPSNYNCPTCALKVIKGVGKEYFAYQEWYNKRWNKSNEDSNPVEKSDVE